MYPDPAYTADMYLWGVGFDVCVNLEDQAAKDFVANNPRKRAIVPWVSYRWKFWNFNGEEIADYTRERLTWIVDGGIFFPDGKKYKADSDGVVTYNLVDTAVARITENNSVFKMFDHPGLSNSVSFANSDPSKIAEVGLYYANFVFQFVDENGLPLYAINYHLKVLLRSTFTTDSQCTGNAEFGPGHITLTDWQNPPTGTQFP